MSTPAAAATTTTTTTTKASSKTKVILFYKYSPLSEDELLMAEYCDTTHQFCHKLNLFGRILLGKSRNEGINGTLSGTESNLNAYIVAMLGRERFISSCCRCNRYQLEAIHSFWDANESFAQRAQIPVFTIDSPQDFKWSNATTGTEENETSSSNSTSPIFPDLYVKVVKEIIGTGGVLSAIQLSEVNQGYLTPEEFHQQVSIYNENNNADFVLIDCRNHNEYQIGNFDGAIDPNTKTFSQFPKWVQDHKSQLLDNKTVLMYCTGGIRCEKASAYIRNQTKANAVFHLRGGVHKYLETYGSDGLFRGKNFVFDRRGSDNAGGGGVVVGKCFYCNCDWDTYTGDAVCCVCRESMLVCPACRTKTTTTTTTTTTTSDDDDDGKEKEYHCSDHIHLRDCYFQNLSTYSSERLLDQTMELTKQFEKIAVGKKYKQKRCTISKQIERIENTLIARRNGKCVSNTSSTSAAKCCRSCGIESCTGNVGECWGFYGRKGEKPTTSSAITTPST